jgi:hypothetical protein
MINNSRTNPAEGSSTMASATGLRPVGRCVKIAVTDEDGPRLLWVIAANRWPTRYLGNNVFVLTEEQVARIKSEGIPFEMITPEK